MITCPTCSDDFSDGVKCSMCALTYCFPCANITETNYRKLGPARQATVLCSRCKSSPRPASPLSQPRDPPAATMELVLQELRNGIQGINVRLDSQLPSIVQEIKNVKGNLQHIVESISSLQSEVAENTSKLVEVDNRVSILETRPQIENDYPQIELKLAQLSSELAAKDQLLRINNIEIKGIPQKKNENLIDLVCQVVSLIGQPITKADINFVTRARSTVLPKPIIVGFVGRYVKENVVASARSRKPHLTVQELGFAGDDTRIYINDHLTRDNKLLLTKAKKLAQELNHRYVWVQSGRILTRKNDTSPIIALFNEDDLLKLK